MADIIDLDDWSFRNAKNAGTRPNGYWAEQWIWTGLESEEIAKIREDVENGYMKSTARRYGISVDRLRELAQADREGRCVVLPKDGMVYYIEEAGGEKWIGNKPIQQVVLRCGFGMALLEFSLFDKGKYFSRAEAQAALRREQE